jgi:aminopeptidase N
MIRYIFLILSFFMSAQLFSQVDWKHYSYAIDLVGIPTVKTIARLDGEKLSEVRKLKLDLVAPDTEGGMKVLRAYDERNGFLRYRHLGDSLIIHLNNIAPGDFSVFIEYEGIPKDGLIISENKFGATTVFGDNWPNRARNWLVLKDHPSEKATVEYRVRVRDSSQCVANGALREILQIDDSTKIYHWYCDRELPSKVMVIGVSNFAIDTVSLSLNPIISSWVYPPDSTNGFIEYAKAEGILNYFSQKIAPYPYSKLANVQSTTRYGGMENASCIFYHEESTKGDGSSESLIAHEIVHQWFGNTATESDWSELWLSEGFATYLTNVYIQENYGEEEFQKGMKRNSAIAFAFFKKEKRAIVDTMETDPNALLNPNVYQKAACILHMIRDSIGDANFFKAVTDYYETYKFSNANSRELIAVFESVTETELWEWISPYLYIPSHPKLRYNWKSEKKKVLINLKQIQKNDFGPLRIDLLARNGDEMETIPIRITKKQEEVRVKLNFVPESIEPSPVMHSLVEFVDE